MPSEPLAPRIDHLPPTRYVGIRREMSFAENRTPELWRTFGPRIREVQGRIGTELFSIEVYPADFFDRFDPRRMFAKWAAVAASADGPVPSGFETLSVTGDYAVFQYRGLPADGGEFYRRIFQEWLPGSGFQLAHRPHFAVMGDRYRNDSADSEEEVWIPVQRGGG